MNCNNSYVLVSKELDFSFFEEKKLLLFYKGLKRQKTGIEAIFCGLISGYEI